MICQSCGWSAFGLLSVKVVLSKDERQEAVRKRIERSERSLAALGPKASRKAGPGDQRRRRKGSATRDWSKGCSNQRLQTCKTLGERTSSKPGSST